MGDNNFTLLPVAHVIHWHYFVQWDMETINLILVISRITEESLKSLLKTIVISLPLRGLPLIVSSEIQIIFSHRTHFFLFFKKMGKLCNIISKFPCNICIFM